jgi:hypothetical protein
VYQSGMVRIDRSVGDAPRRCRGSANGASDLEDLLETTQSGSGSP